MWNGSLGLGIFDDFAVVRPVGARDGKGGVRQVAVEDCRGLVADLRRFSQDCRAFR